MNNESLEAWAFNNKYTNINIIYPALIKELIKNERNPLVLLKLKLQLMYIKLKNKDNKVIR